MIKRNIRAIRLPNLSNSENKGKTFRLIWIQGINVKSAENYYRVLFKEVKSKGTAGGAYLTEYIFPEFLQIFQIGRHYRNSRHMDTYPPVGKILNVAVQSTDHNRIMKVSEVISDNEFFLNHEYTKDGRKISYSSDNKNQYCVVFEDEQQIIVIPCSVVGASYYFISSSMRKQIFSQNLKGLYESLEIDQLSRRVRILLKHNASDEDAIYIVRFASNKVAGNRWNAIKNCLYHSFHIEGRSHEHNSFVPLKIDIPVNQGINMKVRGLKFLDLATRKDKILVFEIIKEDSRFEFDFPIHIQRKEKKQGARDKKEVFPEETFKTSNKVVNKTPSVRLSSAKILSDYPPVNIYARKTTYVKEYLSEEDDSGNISAIRGGKSEVDISVMRYHGNLGEEDVRFGKIEREERKQDEGRKEKDTASFTLDEFILMASRLAKKAYVVDFSISEKTPVPLSGKYKTRYSLRESYGGTGNKIRQYVYMSFAYFEKNVCLIELDHSNLINGPATYVLISDSGYKFVINDIEYVIDRYLRYNKVNHIESSLQERRIIFFSKRHPKKKGLKYYNNWCDDLLSKIAGSFLEQRPSE